MNNQYTWGFKIQFAKEYKNYPTYQINKIDDFLDTFEAYGLMDKTKYIGKISHSWKVEPSNPNHSYAKENNLWHYHIGLPTYRTIQGKNHKTSDLVLHFQWEYSSTHINLVDIYDHYKIDGTFYLPPSTYLI